MPDALPTDAPLIPDSLHRSLGQTMVTDRAVMAELSAALEMELTRRLLALQTHPPGREGIRNHIQAMLSMAVTFGFTDLADRARAVLTIAPAPAADDNPALRRCLDEMQRLLAAVHRLFRPHAAGHPDRDFPRTRIP